MINKKYFKVGDIYFFKLLGNITPSIVCKKYDEHCVVRYYSIRYHCHIIIRIDYQRLFLM